MFEHFFEVFSVLFVVIDPPGIVPIFLGLTHHKTAARKKAIAFKSCAVGLVVLLLFAFMGDAVLDKLGISEPAFRIAGAILLLLTAIDMVVAHHLGFSSPTADEEAEARERPDVSVFPLGIPLIAGPGGMVSIVMLMRKVEGNHMFQFNIILSLCIVVGITWLFLYFATPISRLIGTTGANVMTRLFGIILAALAIQFMINGINDLMIVPFMKGSCQ